MNLMFQPLRKYAIFSGRARRMEYWLFQLLMIVVLLPLFGVSTILIINDTPFPDTVFLILDGMNHALYLALFLPSLTVTVRRLHDTNRSGWWNLLAFWYWIPVSWTVILYLLTNDSGELLVEETTFEVIETVWDISIIFSTLGLVWLIVLLCLRGTRGENRFGPDPLPPEPAAGNSGAGGESTQL